MVEKYSNKETTEYSEFENDNSSVIEIIKTVSSNVESIDDVRKVKLHDYKKEENEFIIAIEIKVVKVTKDGFYLDLVSTDIADRLVDNIILGDDTENSIDNIQIIERPVRKNDGAYDSRHYLVSVSYTIDT